MENVLTQEELKYLERISRYLLSTNMKRAYINIEADPYDGGAQIDDIDWEYITHFDWQGRIDIPSGFIEILKKIFNYIDESGIYSEPDIDSLSYNEFIVIIDAEDKVLTITNDYRYYDVGGKSEVEFEGDEVDMDSFREELNSNGIEIPEDGILTARYNGGGDSGSLDGSFDEINQQVPEPMEDFCYDKLSDNFGGWENNEGGEGYFMFNFNDDTVTLYHTENIEQNDSNTLFELEF
jgi:hypothetical protein